MDAPPCAVVCCTLLGYPRSPWHWPRASTKARDSPQLTFTGCHLWREARKRRVTGMGRQRTQPLWGHCLCVWLAGSHDPSTPDSPASHCQGNGTYHIPEEWIEHNGEHSRHKAGLCGVHVTQKPGHNEEICLQGQSGHQREACLVTPRNCQDLMSPQDAKTSGNMKCLG